MFFCMCIHSEECPIEVVTTFPDAEIANEEVLTLMLPALPPKDGVIPVLRLDVLAVAPNAAGCNFLADFVVDGLVIKMETPAGTSRILNRKGYILRGSGMRKAEPLYSVGGKLTIPFGPDFESADKVMTDNAGTQFLLDISGVAQSDHPVALQVRNLRGKGKTGYDTLLVRNASAGYYAIQSGQFRNAVDAAIEPNIVNVKSCGALGDGIHDDTDAIMRAIEKAKDPKGGALFFPAGNYRVTRTLVIEKVQAMHVFGQSASSLNPKPRASTLCWDGPPGGTLLKTVGIGGCVFENLNFSGRWRTKKKTDGQAGILVQFVSMSGYGNMLNKFTNVAMHNADVGFQMGGEGPDLCNSDYAFDFLTLSELGNGFRILNAQGVDYHVNYLFATACGTVFDFKRGGNLQVNTAQLTGGELFLNIEGGGRCVGTYLCTNVRIESSKRLQLLRCRPDQRQANVRFISYDDAQWDGFYRNSKTRAIPLCEIGPGSMVTIDGAIINNPVAVIEGDESNPAILLMNECSFGFITPENSIQANEFGYFKLKNCTDDGMRVLPDVIKWPENSPIAIKAESVHKPEWGNIFPK